MAPVKLLTFCTLAALAACINIDASESTPTNNALSVVPTTLRVGSSNGRVNTNPTPEYFKKRDPAIAPTPSFIVLDEPPAVEKERLIEKNIPKSSKSGGAFAPVFFTGYGRPIPQTATTQATKGLLKWQKTASGGQIAAINIKSTKAKNLSIGLTITKAPDNALFRFSSHEETKAVERTGREMKTDALIMASGGKNDAVVWVAGPGDFDNVSVEIELPPNMSTDELEISIPVLNHGFLFDQRYHQ